MVTEQTVKPEELSLEKRLLNLHNALVTARLVDAEKSLREDIHKVVEAKRAQVMEAMHKGFGVTSDPVMSASKNLIELGRKIALMKADTGKRTLAKEDGSTPEGTLRPDAITQMFVNVKKGEKP